MLIRFLFWTQTWVPREAADFSALNIPAGESTMSPMSQPAKKLDQLTSTRFIAALSVVIFHGGGFLFPFRIFPFDPLLTSGQTAVSYFYVLSGFVMALAYYRPEKKFDFRAYWTARFSRIYPVYIFAFALTCLVYLDLMARIKAPKIWANIFLYQAWIPRYSQSFNMAAWSLSVEAFFYILFPVLVLWLPRFSVRRMIGWTLGFWVFSQVAHSILVMRLLPGGLEFLAYFPLFHLNAFLLGVAGGVWYLAEGARVSVDQKSNSVFLFLGLGFVSALLIGRKIAPAWFGNFFIDNGLLAPFFLIVVLTLALDDTKISKIMSHPWLVLLGDASYALYILHVPVRWLFERFLALTGSTMSYETMYSIYLPIMIVLSILVFIYIERPARDWLRQNMRKLPLILLDLVLIAGAVWMSFAVALGNHADSFARTQTFVLRIGLAVFFVALLIFRYYASASWRSLVLATGLGSLALSGLLYIALRAQWVEGFPRVTMLLTVTLIFVSIFASRFVIRRWNPALLS